MLLLLSLLLSSLPQQPNQPNEMTGTWINEDPSRMGITHIVIDDRDGHLRAHVWGSCEPTDCDWGSTDLHFTGGSATSVFDLGPVAEKTYFVRLPNDKLLAVHQMEFKDGSNHPEPDRAEIFVREVESQDATSISARNLLKTVADTYRKLSAGRFESEETSDLGNLIATARVKIVFSGTNKWKVETSGTGEASTSIFDGHTVWIFFPEANEYHTRPAGQQQPVVGSYRLLDETPGSKRITGSERVDDVSCTVLTISRPNQTRTLWIDSETKFVRKDQTTSVSPTTGAVLSSETTEFPAAQALTNVDEKLFVFDPEKTHAKPRLEAQREALLKSVGKPAPDFSVLDLQGKEVKLTQLRGKAVLLNFWAIWCGPCRSEMPTIELLHREFADKGLVVLGVDAEEAKTQIAFLQDSGFSFASLVEPRKQVTNLYGVGGVPTTVLIDQQGTIRSYDQGIASYESLRKTLQEMGIQ